MCNLVRATAKDKYGECVPSEEKEGRGVFFLCGGLTVLCFTAPDTMNFHPLKNWKINRVHLNTDKCEASTKLDLLTLHL